MNLTSIKTNLLLILTIIIFANVLAAQESNPVSGKHQEKMEDQYPASKNNFKERSPAYVYFDEQFFMTQVNVDDDGMNIVGDAANEPSIAFDYTDPNNMAIGWRQFDDVSNNFRQAGYGVTIDGGLTWYSRGPIDPGVFRSDPVLDSDSKGNFYYNSLTVVGNNDFVCDVYKSTNGGITWDEGVDAQGGDKQWMVIDKTSGPSNGHIYAYWNTNYSHCPNKGFTRSTDGGQSFEECTAIPDEPFWGTLAVDKNSNLYLAGYNGNEFVVIKSTSAKYADSAVTFHDPVEVDMGGDLPFFGGPNPGGITGQIYVVTDTSETEHSGNVYLLATVGAGQATDIYVAASTDGGNTWQNPVKVNDDAGSTAWQWFGDISVAPDGRIDVVWLDTRNDPGGFGSELFYSFSYDGGQTWNTNVKLSESFDPHIGWPNQNKMGDYFDMVSDEEGAHLAWAATFNGEQDVYYGRIYSNVINSVNSSSELPVEYVLNQNYPNPFNPSTTISFSLPKTSRIELRIFNTLGQLVKVVAKGELSAGTHSVDWNAENMSSGIYFYNLKAEAIDGSSKFANTNKMTLVK